MKKQLQICITALCFTVLTIHPAFAAHKKTDVEALANQVNKLECEVAFLKSQLARQEAHQKSAYKPKPLAVNPVSMSPAMRPAHAVHTPHGPVPVVHLPPPNAAPALPAIPPPHGALPLHVPPPPGVVNVSAVAPSGLNAFIPPSITNPTTPDAPIPGPSTSTVAWPVDLYAPGRSFVTTGPYIGVPLEFSGSNLIINSPSISEDVILLTLRKKINQHYCEVGLHDTEERGHVILSGQLEAQIGYYRPGHGPAQTNIDVTTAELDAYILAPSHWITGLVTFGFDNSGASYLGNSRISNSRVFVDKAFITIGDFQKSPWYLTVGQLYDPFGVYATSMVTPPITKSLGRIKSRSLVVGYQGQEDNAFYAASYIFRGDSYAEDQCGSSSCRINNGGLNVGYKYSFCGISGKIGGGVVANLADSVGMQSAAFGNPTPPPTPPAQSNENLVHRVPAYNFNFLISFGENWDFLAEYVGASTPFNMADLFVNNHGAKPYALREELSYSFKWLDNKPAAFAIGYGHSNDVLPLALPRNRMSAVFNTSLWRNTLESLEFRHDVNYPSSYVAGGKGVSPISATASPNLLGRPDNAITLQMDLYW